MENVAQIQNPVFDNGGMFTFVDELSTFFEMVARLPRNVIVLRANVPPAFSELRRYCLVLGGILNYEGSEEIRTVKYEPSIPNSTALSTDALPLHTDGSFLEKPPSSFMLSFLAKDQSGGGISTFMPVNRILAAAPDWVINGLASADFLFVRTYDGNLSDSYIGPVLYQKNSSMRIRWRSDNIWRPKVIESRGTRAQEAVNWLHDYLCHTEPFQYAAETGDTLWVPNTLMLHGRTNLSPGSVREVLRAWVDGD